MPSSRSSRWMAGSRARGFLSPPGCCATPSVSDSPTRLSRRSPARTRRAFAPRKAYGIESRFAQIDTMAGEFPADTNYLYATYHADGFDVAPSRHKKILILGSGTYRIGSSVEFDWCAVNAAQAASALGYET